MNSAQATFFYGVFVTAAHLCFASDAYKATKGSLLAIDLICARRHKGTLQGQDQTLDSVTRVPEEVWKMIKLEIIDVGLHEAEQSLLRSCFMNKACSHAVPSSWHELESNKPVCCIEHFWYMGGIEQMLQDRLDASNEFVDAYGLAIPYHSPDSNEKYPRWDYHARSPLSIPFRQSGKPPNSLSFPSVLAQTPEENSPSHDTLRFSKDFFNLPIDADKRIRSFLSLFRLDSLNPGVATVQTPRRINRDRLGSVSNQEKSKLEKGSDGSENHSDEAVAPQWYLTAIAVCETY
ncbi:hypothetical protein JCM5353_008307 [Sporobolomyces roseus]